MTGTSKSKSAGTLTVAPLAAKERRLSGGTSQSVAPDIRDSIFDFEVPKMTYSRKANAKETAMSNPIRVSLRKTSERGAALLVSLFALLLISAVGVAMIVAGGTESSLAANFRSSANVFYAALSGVEEGRGRLSPANPKYLGTDIPLPIPVGTFYYVTNPVGGEAADTTATYPDTEYVKEFNPPYNPPPPPIPSVWQQLGRPPGPLYKWVRINAVTEKALGIKVSGGTTALDSTTPLFYDGRLFVPTPYPDPGIPGVQALQVTSLAVLPDGSQKMLQYITAAAIPLTIRAAMFAGTSANMNDNMYINGNTEPACANNPSVYGLKSGDWDNVPGSGRIVGSPEGSKSMARFPYKDMDKLTRALTTDSKLIDAYGTGVTKTGLSSPVYSGKTATLGIPPIVTVDTDARLVNGVATNPDFHRILTITKPGTPVVYLSEGDLALGGGTPSTPGAAVTGHGVLVVRGNLTIDVTNGFLYYGLIVATGNITFKGNSSAAQMYPEIHGAVIAGGAIDAKTDDVKGYQGHVAVIQNACMFQTVLDQRRLVLSFREIPQ